ncbi:heavy metal-binding domain-containing protein [Lutibacter sp.]|uniref:heavy metal-binding domain-containing protein n=1 Tax=Lutibacter sp. TaxID=1925666 RepID=UPI0025BFFB87|nr:heavy metal-binding domain-containing protein [Lutibacter sp.]MCF6181665.1 hypothetical protein [Lutibacter sp.]
MKKITYVIVAIFAVAVIMVSCNKEAKKEKKEIKVEKQEMHNHKEMASAVYQCPMDCEHGKTYDKEGNCPVCNMKLKKVASSNKATDSTKVSCKMNYKNCGKGCKGKMDCKEKTDCKGKTACKGKTDCQTKTACKGKTDCQTKSVCKGNTSSNNKVCAKYNTKGCKENCKGKV